MPVTADADKLERAFAALLDNAAKFSDAGSSVMVRLRREQGTAVLVVEDHGIGISEDDQSRMFDRFSSDRRPVAETGGRRHFGLGLALVSEIATRHGGSVTAENRPLPQRGARLRLVVPAAPAARPVPRPTPVPE